MGKTEQPAWAKHILKLLKQARAKDSEFERFGASSHQYTMSAPASEERIKKFEEQQGIRLPEEYRDFLMLVGNGGAGPHYGLYGLKELENELENPWYHARGEVVIYPKMRDEDWDKAADVCPYAGVLPIESQGCTLMTGLILNGPYRGQVVYYDEDCSGKPFFMREKGFLAWYERWLREVIAGYDDENGFGLNIDGNPKQLMALYEQTNDPEERIDIIESYYKFETLPKEQRTYFQKVCAQEANMQVRMKLIKMMIHFHVPGMTKEIEKLWAYGAYDEAISIISREGTGEVKEAWYEKIFAILPKLSGDGFRDACYIFRAMKDYPNVSAGRLKEALARNDLEKNDRSVLFYCIGQLKGREEVLDYFLDYLSVEEDVYVLIGAVQALRGIKDRRLMEMYIKLLENYKNHENAKYDYKGSQMVLKGGYCMGASRPEGQLVSNLLHQFDLFGLDYRGAWKLLMDSGRWKAWKQQNGFDVPAPITTSPRKMPDTI